MLSTLLKLLQLKVSGGSAELSNIRKTSCFVPPSFPPVLGTFRESCWNKTRFRQPGSGTGGWQKVGWNRLWYRCFGKQNRVNQGIVLLGHHLSLVPTCPAYHCFGGQGELCSFQVADALKRLGCDATMWYGVGISLVATFRLCFSCFICTSMFHHVSQECRHNPSHVS